jgi:hypothetical protein
MFNCFSCKRSIGPRVQSVSIILETRPVVYTGKHPETGLPVQVGAGTEIVKEVKICPGCAGIPAPQSNASGEEVRLLQARVGQREAIKHVRKCRETLHTDCQACVHIVKWYGGHAPRLLSQILSE